VQLGHVGIRGEAATFLLCTFKHVVKKVHGREAHMTLHDPVRLIT